VFVGRAHPASPRVRHHRAPRPAHHASLVVLRRSVESEDEQTMGVPCPDDRRTPVRAENPVTVSEQHVPEGRPRHHRTDESQHDRLLWPSDSST
jgi:hypothetical protein